KDDDLPIMKPFSFFTYQGSLTAPPCTERTIHYVASEPLPIASTPLQLIQEALRRSDVINPATGQIYVSDETTENYRKTQPLNDRNVFYFDHKKYCGPEVKKQKPKPEGHYEKVRRKATEYFYVNGMAPSGLPNSFVVTEKEAKGLE